MASSQVTPVTSIGATPAVAKPARLGDTLMGQLGALLSKALADVTSLEVRTFTSETADTSLAASGDPLVANTRLRAFTRLAIDGDTEQCIPLRATGEPDDALWKLHAEAVAQAREDRHRAIAAAISTLKELAGR